MGLAWLCSRDPDTSPFSQRSLLPSAPEQRTRLRPQVCTTT